MSGSLVTGANGFLAAHLVAALRQSGDKRIIGADVSEPSERSLVDDFALLNVAVAEDVRSLMRRVRPDRVFHLAAVRGDDPERAMLVNLQGTLNVLEAVRGAGLETPVLVVGSAAEYGARPLHSPPIGEGDPCLPDSAYGASKLAATLAAQAHSREHGTRVVIVRLFNPVGAGISRHLLVGALIARIREAIATGAKTVRVGNTDAERDFIAAADAATGCIAALRSGKSGEIYNVCSGRPMMVEEIVRAVIRTAQQPLDFVTDPDLDRGADSSVGSPRKAQDDLGFAPVVPLMEAIREAWAHASGGSETPRPHGDCVRS